MRIFHECLILAIVIPCIAGRPYDYNADLDDGFESVMKDRQGGGSSYDRQRNRYDYQTSPSYDKHQNIYDRQRNRYDYQTSPSYDKHQNIYDYRGPSAYHNFLTDEFYKLRSSNDYRGRSSYNNKEHYYPPPVSPPSNF